jgi:hypothetical protein
MIYEALLNKRVTRKWRATAERLLLADPSTGRISTNLQPAHAAFCGHAVLAQSDDALLRFYFIYC